MLTGRDILRAEEAKGSHTGRPRNAEPQGCLATCQGPLAALPKIPACFKRSGAQRPIFMFFSSEPDQPSPPPPTPPKSPFYPWSAEIDIRWDCPPSLSVSESGKSCWKPGGERKRGAFQKATPFVAGQQRNAWQSTAALALQWRTRRPTGQLGHTTSPPPLLL